MWSKFKNPNNEKKKGVGFLLVFYFKWLYSGSDDHLIVLYDVRAGSQSGAGGKGEGAVAMMQGHQNWVLRVAPSPDGRLLGSG